MLAVSWLWTEDPNYGQPAAFWLAPFLEKTILFFYIATRDKCNELLKKSPRLDCPNIIKYKTYPQ